MRLTELLGERYLWVGALCIVQDVDNDIKAAQLDSMASIYNNTYVTIIAANGWDADHGLRGIKRVTEPRHCSSDNQRDFRESLQPHSSIWYSRAWILQELIFSRLIIMFHY
jgi:Heterokaryon incompatibility protein (HET)